MLRRLVLVLAAAALVALAGGGAAQSISAPTATCTEQPSGAIADCDSWHRSDVRIVWNPPPPDATGTVGCNVDTLASDGTRGEACTWKFAGGIDVTTTRTLRRDVTPPTVASASASRGPDEGGWYNSSLAVGFSGSDATSGIASCTSAAYAGPDSASASVTGTCTDQAGNTSSGLSYPFKYDGTPPSVSADAARPPDRNGWYVRPVVIAFRGGDSTSGIAGCTSSTYSGPDAAGARVSGSCRDQAGNVSSASAAVDYDATPPQVTDATPERPPDANGWYNRPVRVGFAGADATSGIDTCSNVVFKGPDGADATVRGTCLDKAGNVSAERAVPLRYDATPPTLKAVEATPGDRRVALTWTAAGGVESVLVERRPDAKGARPRVVFNGRGATFVDRGVRNGSRYRYRVVAVDAAGNRAARAALVTPHGVLSSPAAGARVAAPVRLTWRAVKGATYYNVQLRVGNEKILSRWPPKPRFVLQRRWEFGGVERTLAPGRYRWDVWPGFGPRSAARYGKRIGTSYFVVRR